jgi:hypothetical protein
MLGRNPAKEILMAKAPPSFLALGIVFLITRFVQQGFTLSFESGFFSLGVIFVLPGLVAYFLQKTPKEPKE